MAKPESPTRKPAVIEAEKQLAAAFRQVEGQAAPEAIKAHVDRLSKPPIRKAD